MCQSSNKSLIPSRKSFPLLSVLMSFSTSVNFCSRIFNDFRLGIYLSIVSQCNSWWCIFFVYSLTLIVSVLNCRWYFVYVKSCLFEQVFLQRYSLSVVGTAWPVNASLHIVYLIYIPAESCSFKETVCRSWAFLISVLTFWALESRIYVTYIYSMVQRFVVH